MRLICEYRPQKYLCGLISANYKKKKKKSKNIFPCKNLPLNVLMLSAL